MFLIKTISGRRIKINKIFIGMAFVFFNFNLVVGYWNVGLFPSFIGYFFILKGLTELSGLSIRFYKMTPLVLIVGAFSAAMYAMELVGGLGSGAVGHILMLTSINLSLYVSYSFIMGLQDIETHRKQDLNVAQLFFAWKVLAVASFLPFVVRIAPVPEVLAILVGFSIGGYFLFVLDKSRRLLYLHNPVE